MSRGDKKTKKDATRTAGKESNGVKTEEAQKNDAGKSEPQTQEGDSAGDEDAQEESESEAVAEDISKLSLRRTTQLRPPRTLETTLFDRLEKLYGPGIKRVLKVQYR